MVNEQDIINKIIAGETSQYKLLIDKYQNPIYRIILKITCDHEDALEVTQDVFIKAFESLKQYKAEFKFFSWVYRIAINSALQHIKKKNKKIRLEDIKEKLKGIPNEETEEKEERYKILDKAINELKNNYKDVILLKYYTDLSYAEISETLNIPEKTVKSRLFDARNLIKQKLAETEYFKYYNNF
jgi:RNA polymerase sigma-70 factor (ECF subfamily)